MWLCRGRSRPRTSIHRLLPGLLVSRSADGALVIADGEFADVFLRWEEASTEALGRRAGTTRAGRALRSS